ncbi:MAG: hypothetical protein ABNH53_03490 [Henriciella sp.]|jgi:hypothetical protein
MTDTAKTPNRSRLWGIVTGAAILALLGGLAFWFQIQAGGGMGWVGWLITATLTTIIYGMFFYFGCLMFENTLEQFIVSDTFKRKNKWLDVETKTRSSDDAKTDIWVKHYIFTRTMFAIGILPLLACIYLFWFA